MTGPRDCGSFFGCCKMNVSKLQMCYGEIVLLRSIRRLSKSPVHTGNTLMFYSLIFTSGKLSLLCVSYLIWLLISHSPRTYMQVENLQFILNKIHSYINKLVQTLRVGFVTYFITLPEGEWYNKEQDRWGQTGTNLITIHSLLFPLIFFAQTAIKPKYCTVNNVGNIIGQVMVSSRNCYTCTNILQKIWQSVYFHDLDTVIIMFMLAAKTTHFPETGNLGFDLQFFATLS